MSFFSPPKPPSEDEAFSALETIAEGDKGQRFIPLGFLIRLLKIFYLKSKFSVAILANGSVCDLQWHFGLFCFCLSYNTHANRSFNGYWFCPTPFITVIPLTTSHNMQVPAIGNGSAIFLWVLVDLISISVFPVTDFFFNLRFCTLE